MIEHLIAKIDGFQPSSTHGTAGRLIGLGLAAIALSICKLADVIKEKNDVHKE